LQEADRFVIEFGGQEESGVRGLARVCEEAGEGRELKRIRRRWTYPGDRGSDTAGVPARTGMKREPAGSRRYKKYGAAI